MRSPPPIVSECLDAVWWRPMPAYIGLSGLTAWLSMVTVVLFESEGVAPKDVAPLFEMALLLMVLFAVLPFLPAVGPVLSRLREVAS